VRSAEHGRALVGGVGYTNLRDGSAGPVLVERLAGTLGPDVDVEDLSYSPIDVMFLLQRRPPYARCIFVGAVSRGSAPGTVRVARWDPEPEPDAAVQERVAEAVSGVISLENVLRITRRFGALPDEVTVIEIEPEDESWGDGLTPTMERALDEVAALLRGQRAEVAGA
jgi:hydrogenase maturation protease